MQKKYTKSDLSRVISKAMSRAGCEEHSSIGLSWINPSETTLKTIVGVKLKFSSGIVASIFIDPFKVDYCIKRIK